MIALFKEKSNLNHVCSARSHTQTHAHTNTAALIGELKLKPLLAFVELSFVLFCLLVKKIVLFSLNKKRAHTVSSNSGKQYNTCMKCKWVERERAVSMWSRFVSVLSSFRFVHLICGRSLYLAPWFIWEQTTRQRWRKKRNPNAFFCCLFGQFTQNTTITTIVVLWKCFSYSITLSAYLFLF